MTLKEKNLMLLKYHSRNWCENFPKLYLRWIHFNLARKGWGVDRGILPTTEIVIDGFPRSANSFATRAFRVAQGRTIHIGNHTHSRANIIEGVRRRLPTLVLIRDPRDALLGFSTFRSKHELEDMPAELFLLQLNARRYLDFYRPLLKYRDAVLTADFSIVIKDYTSVLIRLNELFDCDFRVFEHTEESVESIFKTTPDHLSPSEDRKVLKEQLEPVFAEFEKTERWQQVKSLYQSFVEHPRVMRLP